MSRNTSCWRSILVTILISPVLLCPLAKELSWRLTYALRVHWLKSIVIGRLRGLLVQGPDSKQLIPCEHLLWLDKNRASSNYWASPYLWERMRACLSIAYVWKSHKLSGVCSIPLNVFLPTKSFYWTLIFGTRKGSTMKKLLPHKWRFLLVRKRSWYTAYQGLWWLTYPITHEVKIKLAKWLETGVTGNPLYTRKSIRRISRLTRPWDCKWCVMKDLKWKTEPL